MNSYWLLIAMFGLIGLGNTVYHPADYALLSRHVTPARMSQAYSVHTFAGMLGSALAPGAALLMHGLYGWRGAFLGAAILGLVVAVVLLCQPEGQDHAPAKPREPDSSPTDWRLLMAAPILVSFLYFLLHAFASFGLQNFSVVALGALYGTSALTANSALSGYLVLSALGVLVGGWLAARLTHHSLLAALGMLATAVAAILIGTIDPGHAATHHSHVAFRPVQRHGHAIARHDRSRSHARGLVRKGLCFRDHRLPRRWHHCAAGLWSMLDRGEPRLTFFVIAAFTLLAICAVVCVPRPRGA